MRTGRFALPFEMGQQFRPFEAVHVAYQVVCMGISAIRLVIPFLLDENRIEGMQSRKLQTDVDWNCNCVDTKIDTA